MATNQLRVLKQVRPYKRRSLVQHITIKRAKLASIKKHVKQRN